MRAGKSSFWGRIFAEEYITILNFPEAHILTMKSGKTKWPHPKRKKYLTIKRAAQLINANEKMVYTLVSDVYLPATKVTCKQAGPHAKVEGTGHIADQQCLFHLKSGDFQGKAEFSA